MEAEKPAPDLVIRLLDVALDRNELEAALGVDLDRYEQSRDSSSRSAQVSMDGGDRQWSSVAEFLEMIGPKIRELIGQRVIRSATMDMAIHFPNDIAAISSKVPARIALLTGQNLIDVETSVYPTSPGD